MAQQTTNSNTGIFPLDAYSEIAAKCDFDTFNCLTNSCLKLLELRKNRKLLYLVFRNTFPNNTIITEFFFLSEDRDVFRLYKEIQRRLFSEFMRSVRERESVGKYRSPPYTYTIYDG